MFYLKPIFKASLAPSWKYGSVSTTVISLNRSSTGTSSTANGNGLNSSSEQQTGEQQTSNKRKLITAPEKDPEDLKKQKKIYTPPSGKFSNKPNFRGKLYN